jgi:hypothetical protein
MSKLEAAKQLMKVHYLSLQKNPSRQNKRRIDREFEEFMRQNDIRPSELIDYLENEANSINGQGQGEILEP